MATAAFRSLLGATALALAAASSGCSGLRIHDESRAKLASEAKKGYGELKVADVTAVEQKNQAFLLGEELKAVRGNVALQVDFTMLEIAANEGPMAVTAAESASQLADLLGDSVPLADRLTSIRNGPALIKAARESLRIRVKVFRQAGVEPPDCRKLKDPLELPATLDETLSKRLNDAYPVYRKACAAADPRSHFGGGEIGAAYADWNKAREAHDDALAAAAGARAELRAASAAYDKRAEELAELKLVGEERTAALRAGAARLAKAVAALRKLDDGDETDEVLGALAELLAAAAGGQAGNPTPSLQKAVAVAKELPALAGELAQFEADQRLPLVSGLLLAMRHQAVLAQAAQQRAALAQERIDIMKARADALVDEARHWLGLADALCTHAVLAAGAAHPGSQCGGFVVTKDGTGWRCTLANVPLANCALTKPWKTRLAETPAGPVRRELAKAEMRYLKAIAASASPLEQRFREIDVRHREALLAKQTALRAWDNLVSTPLVQLDNFHQTGLKPQELADLIVKALGLTAIAIGVAQ